MRSVSATAGLIARRELHAFFSQRDRSRAIDFGVSSLEDLHPSPSSLLLHKDDRGLLAEALRQLPVHLQIVLELHYWEDRAGPDIAVCSRRMISSDSSSDFLSSLSSPISDETRCTSGSAPSHALGEPHLDVLVPAGWRLVQCLPRRHFQHHGDDPSSL